jgi:hypothetical protein
MRLHGVFLVQQFKDRYFHLADRADAGRAIRQEHISRIMNYFGTWSYDFQAQAGSSDMLDSYITKMTYRETLLSLFVPFSFFSFLFFIFPCSEILGFESQPGDRLSRLRMLVVLLSSSRQMSE